MSEQLSIFIEMIPPKTTSQQKGVRVMGGKAHFFEKKKVTEGLALVTEELRKHVPPERLTGPIQITIQFVYPWRGSDLQGKRKADLAKLIGWDWHTERPDMSNVVKGVIDRMTQLGYWKDDGQICDERYIKKRGERPSVSIFIRQLTLRVDDPPKGPGLFEVEGGG